MTFAHGRTVYRLRAGVRVDRYSKKESRSDWDAPVLLEIPGAFVASTSTSMLGSATRQQASEAKSLYCSGDFDVQKGDRIRVGAEGGPVYTIDGIPPDADTNPFTGWTTEREIPLSRYVG